MARTYGMLKPGKGKIDVCLRNHNAMQVSLPKQTTVQEIVPADMVPAPLDQNQTGHGRDKKETTTKKKVIKVKKNYTRWKSSIRRMEWE